MTGPLTEDEHRTFFSLLRRVCENHIDQFLQMRLETEPYTWYVDISLHPQAGAAHADLYEPVDDETRLNVAGQRRLR